MIEHPLVTRRGILSAGAGLALGTAPAAAFAANPTAEPPRRILSAAQFGAAGDGVTDDTAALQSALDAAFAQGGTMLEIPPGNYRVTSTLRIEFAPNTTGNVARHCGVRAYGARIVSGVSGGGSVLHVVSNATVRFFLLEGLAIFGSGREGHGLVLECDRNGAYLYNLALRDVVVEKCGGDGCLMAGNVFESQIFNSYFRDNRGCGVTFSHGIHGGILSAIHAFGCVFGQNGQDGAALVRGCYDVSFNGCYFLLNGRYGLAAENGCTLLNGCGFENNHATAKSFDPGNGAIRLVGFGTVLACGAYSVYYQSGLIDAFVAGELVMIGCRGFGDGTAKNAGLGRFAGDGKGNATLMGCQGHIERTGNFAMIEMAGSTGGIRFGADWNSQALPQLGEYRLWVDADGRLRLKKGAPSSDSDGAIVGA